MKFFHDTWILFVHYVRATLREPVWVFVALFQPLCYLFLYAPLLTGMAEKSGISRAAALIQFIPGLLVMLAFFAIFVGFSMIDDVRSGVIERLRVTPASRFALLLGRTLRDVAVVAVQVALLVVASLPLGLAPDLGGIVLAGGFMLLLGLAVAPFSYALALLVKNEDVLAPLTNFISYPMLLLSGILLPMTYAPGWLKIMSKCNPLSYLVDAARELFVGNIANIIVFKGLIIVICLVTVSLWWATRTFNKAIN